MAMKRAIAGFSAVLSLASAAGAADVIVAQPIDYVRVCDVFGNAYWFSPSADTCLSVTGYVRLDARLGPGIAGATAVSGAGNWQLNTKAALTVQARSMTDWGPLIGLMRVAGQSNNSAVGPGGTPAGAAGPINNIALEEYYGALGQRLLFGYTESTFAYGYNVPFRTINNVGLLRVGNVDQLRIGFGGRNWGVAVAAEDPRDRALGTNPATMTFPDIVARLTGSMGAINGQLSAGYGSRIARDTWGLQAGLTARLTGLGRDDAIRVIGAWSNTSPEWVSGGLADDGAGTYWSVLAAFNHVFNAQWGASVYGSYAQGPVSGAAWQAAFVAQFTPTPNFVVSGEVGYAVGQGAPAGAWNGTVRFQRSF